MAGTSRSDLTAGHMTSQRTIVLRGISASRYAGSSNLCMWFGRILRGGVTVDFPAGEPVPAE
jgi:hypothetical protein